MTYRDNTSARAESRSPMLGDLAVDPLRLDSASSAREASARVMPTRVAGALVVTQSQAIGWIPRETLMAYARGGKALDPLALTVVPGQTALPAETPLLGALSAAAMREATIASYPLIVVDTSGPARIVPNEVLLAAAADLAAPGGDRPGRVAGPARLKLRLATLAAAALDGAPARFDLAFIEAADEDPDDAFAARVSRASLAALERGDEDVLVAHDGAAGLVVVAPPNRLDGRIGELARRLGATTHPPAIRVARSLDLSAFGPDDLEIVRAALRTLPCDEPLHGCHYVDVPAGQLDIAVPARRSVA